MTNYPYTLKTGTLKNFLNKIPLVGLPNNVTQKYLYSLGFKSTNDRKVIPVLKFIKFLDESGAPTPYYKQYRDTGKSAKVLGKAINESYAEIFKTFPDAHKQDNASLKNLFSTHTGLGEKAIKSTVDTFKTLCSIADLNQKPSIDKEEKEFTEEEGEDKKSPSHKISLSLSEGRKAQISVPEDIKEEEIEKLKKLLDILK